MYNRKSLPYKELEIIHYIPPTGACLICIMSTPPRSKRRKTEMEFIGIDPGYSGGMALLDVAGEVLEVVAFKKMTLRDTVDVMTQWSKEHKPKAMLEKVHSMPKQGIVSSWKFGEHYGFLQGVLSSSSVPFGYVTPQKWMKRLECRTGGDKNVSKARAQRQWPEMKITHAIADALLIAEYCRLVHIDEIFT